MNNERHTDDLVETVKNAASGYGVIVLGSVCFVLILIAITFIVRVIAGGGAGVGV